MPGRIRLLLGDEVTEVSGFDPHLTVLEWLRTAQRRTGTKEGCAEGDCGACTVVVGELHGDALRYRALNACILLLAALDGKQLLTVEHLAQDGLHPVQRAMVDCHGSQCGFCTPGFVMSLFALYHDESRGCPPSRREIDRCLAGNLCRCTGYAPIVRAARQALEAPAADSFRRDRERIERMLAEIRPTEDPRIEFRDRRWFAPVAADELARLLNEHPDAVMVAGATDLGLWMTKQLRQFPILVHTGHVAELKTVELLAGEGLLEIGAAVTYADAHEALTALYPDLAPMLARLGAVQVRNAGTIGGNIANGSPIGDMPPALIALQARLVLRSREGRREIDLEEFFVEYGRQDLRPAEFIEKIRLPVPGEGLVFRVYKLSKRFDQDISSVCAAFAVQLNHDRVEQVRIAFGGMAGVPARARLAEKALSGEPWNEESIERARIALADDFRPLTDWRASRGYRLLSAQNLMTRFYLESTGQARVSLGEVNS
jgi:xanthine dehydrogenase small subunit